MLIRSTLVALLLVGGDSRADQFVSQALLFPRDVRRNPDPRGTPGSGQIEGLHGGRQAGSLAEVVPGTGDGKQHGHSAPTSDAGDAQECHHAGHVHLGSDGQCQFQQHAFHLAFGDRPGRSRHGGLLESTGQLQLLRNATHRNAVHRGVLGIQEHHQQFLRHPEPQPELRVERQLLAAAAPQPRRVGEPPESHDGQEPLRHSRFHLEEQPDPVDQQRRKRLLGRGAGAREPASGAKARANWRRIPWRFRRRSWIWAPSRRWISTTPSSNWRMRN